MEEKLYLSLHDGISVFSQEGAQVCHAPFAGALTLCVGEESLYCADRSGAIWRFDRETMMEQAVCCGGPGVCDMCLSPCGTRLYALLGEADSIFLSSAKSGRPLALNRCGCNPRSLTCCGDLLVAAGGESGCVHLYSAHTLECIEEIPMPGAVHSALVCDGAVYALCLMADLNTMLVVRRGESRATLKLCGMPGCLCAAGDCVFASVHGRLYAFSRGGRLLGMWDAPGRASRICVCHTHVYLYDPLSECVFFSRVGEPWRLLCSQVNDMCLC